MRSLRSFVSTPCRKPSLFWLVALLALSGAVSVRGADLPGVTLDLGANFYAPEIWAPGKVRQWMSNNGEIVLANTTVLPQTINLRFYAEAFHNPRELRVMMGERMLAQWRIEPRAQRYIVIKALTLDPGRHWVQFQTPQGAHIPAQVTKNSDHRPLSIAFSPFSVIAAGTTEAQTEWTAPFAAVPRESRTFSPQENVANGLRREGRLVEAARAYELAMARGVTDYTYPFYGITLLALDRRAEAMRLLQRCADLRGWSPRAWVRGLCRRTIEYVEDSLILVQNDSDPGRRSRAEGRIYQAVEIYERAVASNPEAAHSHYWLAVLNGLAERRPQARWHMERVISLLGDTPDAQFLRSLRMYF